MANVTQIIIKLTKPLWKYLARFGIVPEFVEIMKEFKERIEKNHLKMKTQVKCLQFIQVVSQKITKAL